MLAEKEDDSNRLVYKNIAVIALNIRYPMPLPFVKKSISVLLRGLLAETA